MMTLIPWFQYFNKAGIAFLNFLIAKKKQKLLKLDEGVCILKNKLEAFKTQGEYKKKSEVLKKHLEKEVADQKSKKWKKYLGDVQDYKNTKVFKWQFNDTQGPNPASNIPFRPPMETR